MSQMYRPENMAGSPVTGTSLALRAMTAALLSLTTTGAGAAQAYDDSEALPSESIVEESPSADMVWTAARTPCESPGLFQQLDRIHDKGHACWIGRIDALIAWRNAPPNRPLVDSGDGTIPVLNANQLNSTAAAGPRAAILREDTCTGNALEFAYFRTANFRSQRALPEASQYALAPPGIYNNQSFQPFDTGTVNLGSMAQGFEANHYRRITENIRWLAGFRWVEWQEQFSLQDQLTGGFSDLYQTACINDLYGGQIGADARLLSTSWLRVDSVVKAGAYYNNAVQTSLYTFDDGAGPTTAVISVGQSPASCGFVGEVGITGSIPLTKCIDVRIGYTGLWLSGIAQPTQQLSGQTLVLPQPDPPIPDTGTLVTNGGVLIQAVSIGLEGRW